jgi:DNA polymerase-3 subunit epsilon
MILKKPIVFFDLESTGLSLSEDRVIEIGMIKIHPDNTRETYSKRVNPDGHPISEGAFDKHKISAEDLEFEPKFKDIAKEVYDFINGCDLGGYNCKRFDVPLLVEEFIRVKIFYNPRNITIYDSFEIYSKLEPRTLEATYKRFTGKTLDNAHSADADIEATIEVFEKQIEYFKLPQEIEKINEILDAPNNKIDLAGKLIKNDKNEIIFSFGKHKGSTIQEVYKTDKGYYSWIVDKSKMTRETKIIFSKVIKKLSTE